MDFEEVKEKVIETNVDVKHILEFMKSMETKYPVLESRVSVLEGDKKAQDVRNQNFMDSIKNWTLANTIGVLFSFLAALALLLLK